MYEATQARHATALLGRKNLVPVNRQWKLFGVCLNIQILNQWFNGLKVKTTLDMDGR